MFLDLRLGGGGTVIQLGCDLNRSLLKLFGMSHRDYKRFLNFLAAHECRADFREFRNGAPEVARRPVLVLPPLPPKPADRTEKSAVSVG